jgi:cyclopropane fatty-acyl-phospholipid synthase-like methyltransferase
MTAIPIAFSRNRDPILNVLKQVIAPQVKRVLEIGSGTGHHAVYFASQFPQLQWTTSDLAENHLQIRETTGEARLQNISGPLEFEAGKNEIPLSEYDLVFSANTLHIMAESKVKILVRLLGRGLKPQAQVLFYGPFNYQGRFTSDSNAEFDRWLKSVDPVRGIRAFEDLCEWMMEAGFRLVHDYAMPANNRILHFAKELDRLSK